MERVAVAPDERFATALELASAFRDACGLAVEPAPLPTLDDATRSTALLGSPQPLADALAAIDAAHNPHQARDALTAAARVLIRLVAILSLASRHARFG